MHSGWYLAGTGTYVPSGARVIDAIREGLYPEKDAMRSGQLEASVAPADVPAVALAVRAAHSAVGAAKADPTEIGFLAYAAVLDSGPLVWDSAAYVQQELGL